MSLEAGEQGSKVCDLLSRLVEIKSTILTYLNSVGAGLTDNVLVQTDNETKPALCLTWM